MTPRLFFAVVLGAFLAVVACTPAQRAEVSPAVPAFTHAACVLIHGFARSSGADTVCATADDLAPFVAELLAARAAEPASSSARVAFAVAELPTPKTARAPPRRRCALWVPVSSLVNGSSSDASATQDAEAGSGQDAAAR